MTYYNQRTEKTIEREIASILLLESKNQLLKFVTITKVSLSKDSSLATVWFTVRGEENEIKATISALEDAKDYIRTALAKKVVMKKHPDLKFKYDDSLENANKIEKIIENFKKED